MLARHDLRHGLGQEGHHRHQGVLQHMAPQHRPPVIAPGDGGADIVLAASPPEWCCGASARSWRSGGWRWTTAAKNRYRNAPVGSAPDPGIGRGQTSGAVMPNSQESRMPVKNGGTAMHSWLNTVRTASPQPCCARAEATTAPGEWTPRQSAAKLRRLRHRVIHHLGGNQLPHRLADNCKKSPGPR